MTDPYAPKCEPIDLYKSDDFTRQVVKRVKQLLAKADSVDGIAPFSEEFLRGVEDSRFEHSHLILWQKQTIVGVAAIAGDTAEMCIGVNFRKMGYGQYLYDQLAERVDGIKVWAHGNSLGARKIARHRGLKIVRHLVVMALVGDNLVKAAEDDHEYEEGAAKDFESLNYDQSVERFGRDWVEEAWIKTNNEAFSWHPEQGGWDRNRLHRVMEAEWFDPADALFLWDETTQNEPKLVGFHWTKWHQLANHKPFGEVYVMGIAKDYRGSGIGKPLLQLGLKRMVNKGATEVILYVEKDNDFAVRVYQNSGFSIAENHVVYSSKAE